MDVTRRNFLLGSTALAVVAGVPFMALKEPETLLEPNAVTDIFGGDRRVTWLGEGAIRIAFGAFSGQPDAIYAGEDFMEAFSECTVIS